MFDRIIVAVDGSDASWRGVEVADRLALKCEAELELLHVEFIQSLTESDRRHLRASLELVAPRTPDPLLTIVAVGASVAETIAGHVAGVERSLLVMSSNGHGRSEIVLGSVAEAVVARVDGPVVVVGPDADVGRTDRRGAIVVPVDGSANSESVLDFAAAWSTGFGARAWLVTVTPEAAESSLDVRGSFYIGRLARRLTTLTHRPTEFEVLHDRHPARAITDFASSIDAALVVSATHGRTGLARLAYGSVAAGIVRHAPCPVLLLRPPSLPRPGDPTACGAARASTPVPSV